MSEPAYTRAPLPRMRQLVADIGWFARQSDPILGLLEIDVTNARQQIATHEAATGEKLSFTAFLAGCVAQAVDEHPEVHALRDWRGQLVTFAEVDIVTMVEIVADGRRTPVGLILRAANRKTLRELHEAIRGVQANSTHSSAASMVRWLTAVPRPLRRWLIRLVYRMPQLAKKLRGTVVLTAVGMFGQHSGWAVTLPSHSLVVLVGSITAKPAVVQDTIAIRDILHLTLAFDHIVVDGAPAARFAERLCQLVESAHGLPG